MSYRDEDHPALTVLFIIVMVLAFIFAIWFYNHRYDECMRIKNDDIICTIYARGGG